MKNIFFLILAFIFLCSAYPSNIKVADRAAYDKYLAYCKIKVPYTVQQEGRTTYDHLTVIKNDILLGNGKMIKAGTVQYFENIADTTWFVCDPMDFMENSLVRSIMPDNRFVDSPKNGWLCLEKYGSPRFKQITREIQTVLKALGYPLTVDGIYGSTVSKYLGILYNIPAVSYTQLSVDMLLDLRFRANLKKINTSGFTMGKKSVRITRSKTFRIPKRRATAADFLNGFNGNGRLYSYFKNLP